VRDAGREGGVRCFSVVFIRFFLFPSNNYYLFLNGISFLFSLPFTGEPVYSFFLLFSSLSPFLKCSTKWGITIFFPYSKENIWREEEVSCLR